MEEFKGQIGGDGDFYGMDTPTPKKFMQNSGNKYKTKQKNFSLL